MINPYNFVRADKQMLRREPAGHDRLRGLSGSISCRLQVVTPIFTPTFALRSAGAPADLRFFRIDNNPALPGSSLKGMLRSLAEAICNGCSPFDNRVQPPCRSADLLCPACRVFGYLKGRQVHAGHVGISDAVAEAGYTFAQRITLKELSSPKPQRHAPFYEKAAGEHGRKFYYHQEHIRDATAIPTESSPTHRNVRIEPLVGGSFNFTVRYWNIEEADLGLLLYALDLPSGMYHKFGMGKSLGLGTVRIDIVGWREDDPNPDEPASRYRDFNERTIDLSLQSLEGDALVAARQQISERLESPKHHFATQYSANVGQPPVNDLWTIDARNIQDLRVMLSLVNYSREIHYPGYDWFRKHGSERLPTVQEVDGGERLPDE